MMVKNFFSGTLRTKILLGFLFPIIPMLAIVFVNYYPTRNTTLETGWRLMELSSKSYSEKLGTYFAAQETQFKSWTAIDVFGMAIEFDTLQELKDHFSAIMINRPEFFSLILTDKTGTVLEASFGVDSQSHHAERLIGIKVPGSTTPGYNVDFSVGIVNSDLIKASGHDEPHTLLYRFRTRNSSGEPNGFLLAFLDWSHIRAMMEAMLSEMHQNGFGNSRIALVDDDKQTVICRHGDKASAIGMPSLDTLKAIGSGNGKKADKVRTDRGQEYVLSSSLKMASDGFFYDQSGSRGADLYLAVWVPEKEILLRVHKTFMAAVAIAGAGGFLFLIICIILAQSITHPMRKLVEVLEAYGKGDMNVRAELKSKDEIGYFAQRFNVMLEQINQSAKTLQSSESKYRFLFRNLQDTINKGDYGFRFKQESNEDDLALSLNRMLGTLEDAQIKNRDQDWLKSGQADLNETISGERNLEELCRNGLAFIAAYVDAQVGTLFVHEPEKEELRLLASYAFRERKGLGNRFRLGEGLVGQAALEKKRIVFSQVPDDYITIESSLGATVPKTIIALPLIYNDKVRGVVELGSVSRFTKLEGDFIELAGSVMAVSIYSAMFNAKLQTLFEQTKRQSEELQRQQIELKQANDDLGDQAAMLEEQTATLKISEAKLQKHQRELQANNRELEEKTELLKSQKAEIEKKNSSLQEKQQEVEEKAKQLELATKYKSEFLANMSHELRTPLNSMLLLAKILSDNGEKNLSKDQIDSAAAIHRSGQNLLHLINDILDLSKIEANKIELSISTVESKRLVAGLHGEFRHLAKQKDLSFKTDVADELPDSITTDVHRLEQVLRNLLGNAFKFTEKGSVTLEVAKPDPGIRFQRNDLDPKTSLSFSVRDTGPGIPEDHLKLIFEAFKQVDGSISRRHGGTGLGLSISRELAFLIGGELTATSVQGEGAVFTVYVPEVFESGQETDLQAGNVAVVEVPVQEAFHDPEDRDVKACGKKYLSGENKLTNGPDKRTMLIVEDDNEFAVILADFFQKNGYESIIASDGETGIKYVIEHQPAAIILDIGLPGIDGWAVLNELKSNPDTRHIPVHIMSAFDKSREGLEKGAVGYLTKPVDTTGLEIALKKIETVLSSDVKDLLVVENDPELRLSILKHMGTNDINAVAVKTGEEAILQMQNQHFGCMILDLGLPDISGFELLDRVYRDETIEKMPVIIYMARELTQTEKKKLKRYSAGIVLKQALSMERLLDETALFMHRVEECLPENQQKALQEIRDRESVLPGKAVLVVDDNMRSAYALKTFLKSRGMVVTIADNGKKALELLNEGYRPDIVLMDIMMPVMDGYETLKRIRKLKQYRDLPILALTAKAMESDREECIKCGANDYLSKPVDTKKLLSMLRVWLYKL